MQCVGSCKKNEVDGLRYNVTSEDEFTVEVTYISVRKNYQDTIIIIPSKITYEGQNYNVTGIGKSAFQRCVNLKM